MLTYGRVNQQSILYTRHSLMGIGRYCSVRRFYGVIESDGGFVLANEEGI
jgi:hypothetical protein